MIPMVSPGQRNEYAQAFGHGCIHTYMDTNDTVSFHVGPTTGKYYTALVQTMGLAGQSLDYLQAGSGIYLRGRMYMKTAYTMEHTTDGQRHLWHFNWSDLGFNGLMYISMMINEILIVIIDASDVLVVAFMVVRPILNWNRRSGSFDSTSTSTKITDTTTTTKYDKESKLSKVLLFTDLTFISYRKPLLSVMLVVDALMP